MYLDKAGAIFSELGLLRVSALTSDHVGFMQVSHMSSVRDSLAPLRSAVCVRRKLCYSSRDRGKAIAEKRISFLDNPFISPSHCIELPFVSEH